MKKIVLASSSPRRRELLKSLDIDFDVKVIKGIDESYPADLPAPQIPQYIAREKAAAYTSPREKAAAYTSPREKAAAYTSHREKAAAYSIADDEILLTADTVVVLDNEIMGKPKDAADAHRMLRELSGRTHHVITGVCLTWIDADNNQNDRAAASAASSSYVAAFAASSSQAATSAASSSYSAASAASLRQQSFSDTTAVTFRELSDAEIDYYIKRYKPFDKAGAYGIQEWIGYIGVTRIDGSFYNVMGLPVERVYEALRTIEG